MLAYNKVLLENTDLVSEVTALEEAHFISKEQLRLIEKQLPSYPQTNLLVRIGLFILGCFLFSSFSSIFTLMTLSGGNSNFGLTLLLYAIFGFVGLEFIIRKWKYFGNGIDNAFLYCAELSLILAVGFFIGELDHLSPTFLFATILGLFCTYRYVDQFSVFVACAGFTAFVANGFFTLSPPFRSFVPSVLMVIALGFCFIYLRIKKSASEIYTKCLNVCYVFGLVLFYLSGNYFVVRESSLEFFNMYLEPGDDIPLAFLFYALTIFVPLAYIYFALVKKDRILLWIGLLCTVASVFTIRHYYSLMPAELALMLGGIILFGVTFFVMKKLKTRSSGLIFEPDRFANTNAFANAEVLVLLQRYAVKPVSPDHSSDVEFGGGEFGGGGSGNEF